MLGESVGYLSGNRTVARPLLPERARVG
jgi:hypothetical protein